MNHIERVRAEIATYIDLNSKIGDSETNFSLTKKYRIESAQYQQTQPETNYEITKTEVFDNETGIELFSLFVNWGKLFYTWITKDNIEYLMCSEDIYGGQTIIDLTNRKMASYSPGEDGFIGTDYYLSPESNVMGIVGCYWGEPWLLKFYHFENPMKLPLTEFYEVVITKNLNDKISWMDNETILFKNETSGEESVLKIDTAHHKKINPR